MVYICRLLAESDWGGGESLSIIMINTNDHHLTVTMISRLESALVKLQPCLAFPLTLLMSLSGLNTMMMPMMMPMMAMMMMMMMMMKVGGIGNSPMRSSNNGKSSQLFSTLHFMMVLMTLKMLTLMMLAMLMPMM